MNILNNSEITDLKKIETTYYMIPILRQLGIYTQQYGLGKSFKSKIMPLVGFATVNFYNEINNPQHRGMFQFFDCAFIGKPLDADFIENLSVFPRFVNENL